MLQAEAQHRDQAIVEQLIADCAASALADLSSGGQPARGAGALSSAFQPRPTTPTIRAHLINIPTRLARSSRLTLPLSNTCETSWWLGWSGGSGFGRG